MSTNTYFHLATQAMSPGTVIEPGNWGRILNAYVRPTPNWLGFGDPWVVAREMTYEAIRAAKYPDRPSRLSSAFVFETLEHANQSKGHYARWSSLYEVELVTPDAPLHRAAYNLIDWPAPNVEFIPVIVQRAEAYWRGDEIHVAEIITKSALRVLQLISSGPGTYQP